MDVYSTLVVKKLLERNHSVKKEPIELVSEVTKDIVWLRAFGVKKIFDYKLYQINASNLK